MAILTPALPAGTDVRLIADALLERGPYGGAERDGGMFFCPIHREGKRPNLRLAVGQKVPYLVGCFVCRDKYEDSTSFRNALIDELGLTGRLAGKRPTEGDEVDWGSPASFSEPRSASASNPEGKTKWDQIDESWKRYKVAVYDYPWFDGSPKNRIVRDEAYDPETGLCVAKRLLPYYYDDWGWNVGWGGRPKTPMDWDWSEAWEDEILHITEGEKDAARLTSLGLNATTYAFGGFPDDPSTIRQHLGRLKAVWLYGDLDEAGFAKARKRAALLREAGYEVRTRFVNRASYEAATGRSADKADVSDWLDGGFRLRDMIRGVAALKAEQQKVVAPSDAEDQAKPSKVRRLVARSLADVVPRRVEWVWEGLIPVGELTLLAGKPGIGKSTLGYQLAADLTRGSLSGAFIGSPRNVLILATEDSIEHTIVPRLMAAGADRSRIFEITVQVNDRTGVVDFGKDLADIEYLIGQHEAALVVLDPLMSRMGKSDTHKDSDVREVLEPLVTIAHNLRAAILGLMHLNKSASNDPLTKLMGSVAFGAVARSVLMAAEDPKDQQRILLGQPKANLGATLAGTKSFRVETAYVKTDDEQTLETSRISWTEDDARSIAEVLAEGDRKGPTVAQQAAEWLTTYLLGQPNQSASRTDVLVDAETELWKEGQIQKGFAYLKKRGIITSERAKEPGGAATWTIISGPTVVIE